MREYPGRNRNYPKRKHIPRTGLPVFNSLLSNRLAGQVMSVLEVDYRPELTAEPEAWRVYLDDGVAYFICYSLDRWYIAGNQWRGRKGGQ